MNNPQFSADNARRMLEWMSLWKKGVYGITNMRKRVLHCKLSTNTVKYLRLTSVYFITVVLTISNVVTLVRTWYTHVGSTPVFVIGAFWKLEISRMFVLFNFGRVDFRITGRNVNWCNSLYNRHWFRMPSIVFVFFCCLFVIFVGLAVCFRFWVCLFVCLFVFVFLFCFVLFFVLFFHFCDIVCMIQAKLTNAKCV